MASNAFNKQMNFQIETHAKNVGEWLVYWRRWIRDVAFAYREQLFVLIANFTEWRFAVNERIENTAEGPNIAL